MSAKFLFDGDLSERQVENDFAAFLGIISERTGNRLRLLDVNEQLTGADGKLNVGGHILPMYIQFKVSTLIQTNGRPIPVRYTQIAGIRDFRSASGFAADIIYYFKLRKLAEKATELQHNVLYRHNTSRSLAFYLAPLTVRKQEFYDQLTGGLDFYRWYHWRDIISASSLRHAIALAPGFRCMVTVTPHAAVSTHEHCYSYSANGEDICFHSPLVVESGIHRFSDFIYNAFGRARERGYSSIEELAIGQLKEHRVDQFDNQLVNPYSRFLDYVRELREKHEIRTFLFSVAEKVE